MKIIQSILFPKNEFSIDDAKLWLIQHNLYHLKLDETKNFYRFRQVNPDNLKKFIIETLPNKIELVIQY